MANKKKKLKKRYILLLILGILFLFGIFVWVSLPRVSLLKKMNPCTTSLIKYKERNKKIKTHIDWIKYSHLSKYLIYTVLIAEDDKFYHHSGFDFEAIKKSATKNLKEKRIISGGSTITQQLAKNLYLSSRRSIIRKLREALITIRLERRLDKKRILEIYLNVIEFGKGIYGIKSASWFYFKKYPSTLNIEESIRLVSILPNPIRYSPLSNNSRRMNNKRNIILDRMYKRELIDEEKYHYLKDQFKKK